MIHMRRLVSNNGIILHRCEPVKNQILDELHLHRYLRKFRVIFRTRGVYGFVDKTIARLVSVLQQIYVFRGGIDIDFAQIVLHSKIHNQ